MDKSSCGLGKYQYPLSAQAEIAGSQSHTQKAAKHSPHNINLRLMKLFT